MFTPDMKITVVLFYFENECEPNDITLISTLYTTNAIVQPKHAHPPAVAPTQCVGENQRILITKIEFFIRVKSAES